MADLKDATQISKPDQTKTGGVAMPTGDKDIIIIYIWWVYYDNTLKALIMLTPNLIMLTPP